MAARRQQKTPTEEPLYPRAKELLDHARSLVTHGDIIDFCPGDPGYKNYVRVFLALQKSGVLPGPEDSFELTETIGLTRWCDPTEERKPERLRRFRVFTNVVALYYVLEGDGVDRIFGINYIPVQLIEDCHQLGDKQTLALLAKPLCDLHSLLLEKKVDEAPFVLLALLLLHFMQVEIDLSADRVAQQLIEEEAAFANEMQWSTDFLFRVTNYDQFKETWKRLVAEHFPCKLENEALEMIRSAILD